MSVFIFSMPNATAHQSKGLPQNLGKTKNVDKQKLLLRVSTFCIWFTDLLSAFYDFLFDLSDIMKPIDRLPPLGLGVSINLRISRTNSINNSS